MRKATGKAVIVLLLALVGGWCCVCSGDSPQALAAPNGPAVEEIAPELQETAEGPLRLEVWSANNLTYMVGEPIMLGLTFRNTGTEPIRVDLGHLGRRTLEVTCNGQGYQSRLLDLYPGGLSQIFRATLASGATYHHSILLNEWVSFDQAGTYNLRISYDGAKGFGPTPQEARAACDLTITVRPKAGQLSAILKEWYQSSVESNNPLMKRKAAELAICYCGQEQALPFLSRLIDGYRDWLYSDLREPFKGVRLVGTLAALDLLADLKKNEDPTKALLATVEIGLLRQTSADPAIQARAEELLRDVPSDFRFVEPTVMD